LAFINKSVKELIIDPTFIMVMIDNDDYYYYWFYVGGEKSRETKESQNLG